MSLDGQDEPTVAKAYRVPGRKDDFWVYPPTGRNPGLFRFYCWLDLAGQLAAVLPLLGVAVWWWFNPNADRDAVSWLLTASAGFMVGNLVSETIWGKSPLRLVSHYHNNWLEEGDSRPFCRFVLADHFWAVRFAVLVHVLVCVACLVGVCGGQLVVRGYALEGGGAVGAAFLAVVGLAVIVRTGTRSTGGAKS